MGQSASGFDYFGNVGAQQVVAPPHRYRTTSTSSTGSGRRRRTTSGSSTGSVKAAPPKAQPAPGTANISAPKADDKKQKQAGGGSGSGWFGGIFSKFSAKGKNEMILPDDKDPAIVWDPVKKKWMNSDGTEDEVASAAPPPKDADLMGGKSGGPPSGGPPPGGPMGGPPPPSSVGGNKFSLKAKGGGRNQYVDVNNPKPVSVPQDLFNVMPPTSTMAPTAAAGGTAPQVFMPGAGDANNSNTSDGLLSVPSQGSQPQGDVQSQAASAAPAQQQQVPAMPMLFNPATLQSGQGQTAAATGAAGGRGLKYGQRRAYPK